MNFWETAAGHNLANLMNYFFQNKMAKKQYTKILHESEIGTYVEAEIKKGNRYIDKILYDKHRNEYLVIMED